MSTNKQRAKARKVQKIQYNFCCVVKNNGKLYFHVLILTIETMSQPPGSHSSRYESPNNIVIVPTVYLGKNSSIQSPALAANIHEINKRIPQGNKQSIPSEAVNTMAQPKPLIQHQCIISSVENQLKQTSDQIEPIPISPESSLHEDDNKNLANVEDMNKTKKANSWASNYLQSIGHNNKKPIKMSLSLSRNKIQRVETISTNNEISQIPVQSTLYKHTETFDEVFNVTDNSLELNELNNNIIGEHINIGNVKTLYPTVSDEHHTATTVLSKSNDIRALVNSNILVDTIYSKDRDSKVPAYATLLAKSSGEAAYCYNEGHREIDILGAIKSKINRDNATEQNSRAMNLPTHKDMCEDFIKEISINKSESNGNRSKSSPPAKSKELERVNKKKSTTPKPDAKIKNDKKIFKESSKIIKKINKKCLKKMKSSVTKTEKIQKKMEQEYQRFKKKQNSKPIIDLKDFDNLSKHILDKKIDRQPAIGIPNPERPNLKRVCSTSEDIRNSSEVISNSSIRSAVRVTDNHQINPPKRQCFEESFDLRSKLSRANQRLNKNQPEIDFNKKPKQRENIKITVENQNDEKQKSPKKSGVLKYKTKKCKKLKLIINVVCRESDDETTSSDSCYSETENNATHNIDLSFLDDFNVDEIVDSLRHSPKHKIKSPPPHDSKTEIHTNMPVEPEFKLATILNMLSAKSEINNSFITSVKTECKNEEIMGINGTTKLNKNDSNPVSEISSISKKVESKENKINVTQNTTHDLVKILCQTNFQLQQQKPATSDANIGGLQSEESNVGVNMNQANKPQSEDDLKLIMDESVKIHENEISIIDLTDEYVCADSETNNIAVSATPNNIQQEVQDNEKKKDDINKFKPHQFVNVSHNKIEKPNTHHEKYKFERAISKQYGDIIIDLTDDSINVDKEHKTTVLDPVENIHHTIHAGTVKPKNSSSQMDVENDTSVDQVIHSTPLQSVNYNLSNENEKPIETTVLTVDSEHENKLNIVIPMETDQPMESVQMISPTNIGLVNSDIQIKEIITTKPDTVKNLKSVNQENLVEIAENVSDNSNTSTKDNSPSAISNLKIMFAQKVLENVTENVRNTKNESKTKTAKIESGKICKSNDKKEIVKPFHTNVTKIEIGNASKMNTTVGNDTTVGLSNSDDLSKELLITKPDSVNSVKQINESIKTQQEKSEESAQNISGINNSPSKTNVTTDSKNYDKMFETKTALKVLEKIVENVWDTKNELGNIPETKKTKNDIGKPSQASGTKTEIGNASKPNIEKKDPNESNVLLSQHKALAVLLEEKMRGRLNIKVIKHIHHGKFSNIFSCKDSNGETYAAKVLTYSSQKKNRALVIERELMIRQLQQDIPRENLNTLYLIDGFGVERQWCYLTEYYPKNLKQVLMYQKKPFHIDRVQDLARQLILAVMVLRNNNVVHSDIKPGHILLNSTYDRLKLCGFDAAYYKNDSVHVTPNIGTVAYRAPEIILGFSAGYSIDVWASALVIYQMATNTKLFNGVYNNDILYKQMCTFGSLPWDMLERSFYMNRHFQGGIFMRRVGPHGQDAILYDNFFKTTRLQKSLWVVHKKHWPAKAPNVNMKLEALTSLLELMLALDPRQRLAVEFVCADPFIYEVW